MMLLFLFSLPVVSNSLRPHGLQRARPPCPSPSPKVCPGSCPLHQKCHPAISRWCPLLLLPSIFPSIRDFSSELAIRIRWPKYWNFSFSISSSNKYSWLISLKIDGFAPCCPRDSQESSPAPQFEGISSSMLCLLHGPALKTNVTTGKTIALIQTFVGRVMSLLFNTLSRFVITLPPRSSCLLISRLQSPSAVIWEPKKGKSVSTSTISPSICHAVMGSDATILVLLIVLNWLFHSPPSPSSRGSLVLFTFCH